MTASTNTHAVHALDVSGGVFFSVLRASERLFSRSWYSALSGSALRRSSTWQGGKIATRTQRYHAASSVIGLRSHDRRFSTRKWRVDY